MFSECNEAFGFVADKVFFGSCGQLASVPSLSEAVAGSESGLAAPAVKCSSFQTNKTAVYVLKPFRGF